jgi:hypothetical protein
MKINAPDHSQLLSSAATPSIARGLRIVPASAPLPRPAGLPSTLIPAMSVPIECLLTPPMLSFAPHSEFTCQGIYSHD